MYALRGQVIQLQNIGSLAAVTIEAQAVVRSRGGSTQALTIEAFTAQSDRTLSDPIVSDERTRFEGEVVTASVRLVSGSPVRGQLFCILSIRNGSELCRGHLTSLSGVNLGQFEDSLGGKGLIRTIDLGDPAANAEFATQTVPANVGWRVVSWAAVLAQGATQTPRPSLFFSDDSGVEVVRMSWGATQAANVTASYGAFLGAANSHVLLNAVPGGGGSVSMPLPDITLPAGYDIDSDTINKGANTNWGDGQLLVEEWLVA